MEEETHKNKLSLLCFVCGEFFKKSFYVSTHLKNLRKAFYIYDETSYSDENIYPQKFCRKCYLKLMDILKRKTTTTPISIPVWEKHTPGLCKVCTDERDTKGGKRKKIKLNLLVAHHQRKKPCGQEKEVTICKHQRQILYLVLMKYQHK